MKTAVYIALVAAFFAVIGVSEAAPFVCKNPKAKLPNFRAITHGQSDNARGLTTAFEHFKEILGGDDNGSNPGPLRKGHRSINWDAPIVPFEFPRKFFEETVTRGLAVASKNNKFRVSNPSPNTIGDDKFSTINRRESKKFQTFSPERLFTPIKDNEFWIRFTVPGKRTKALVRGFGAVFVGVDFARITKMTAYDIDDCVIASEYVDAKRNGLSFLGIYFEKPIIARVVILLGNFEIDAKNYCGYRCDEDIVVLDDFLYGEPQSIFD